MLTNPRAERVMAVRSLHQRAVRSRSDLFLADGPQAVREAVRYAAASVTELYLTPEAAARHTEIVADAARAGIRTWEASAEVLAVMSDTGAPQGLAAVCRQPHPTLADVLTTAPGAHSRARGNGPVLVVVLVHVRDPGNAGTVIRCADAAGADAVVVTDASVDVWGPKVVRASAGSIFHLPVVAGLAVEDGLNTLRDKGIRLFAADGSGERLLGDLDLSTPHAWVMGNEAWGLPADVEAACDEVVRVPIYGAAESLNLATAATVCLYASAQVFAGRSWRAGG